jgi:hypothetical protein
VEKLVVVEKGNGISTADLASMLIALAALAFTIGSFWWMNVRRGRLRLVGEPRSFAISTSGGLHLTIPLSFHNSGPTPAWATNLRLNYKTPGLPPSVPFVATRSGVRPQSGEDRALATQAVLAGRESRVICCEFITRPFECQIPEAEVKAQLEVYEVRTWGRARWRTLGEVPLRFTSNVIENQTSYGVVHDNQPGLSDGTP